MKELEFPFKNGWKIILSFCNAKKDEEKDVPKERLIEAFDILMSIYDNTQIMPGVEDSLDSSRHEIAIYVEKRLFCVEEKEIHFWLS